MTRCLPVIKSNCIFRVNKLLKDERNVLYLLFRLARPAGVWDSEGLPTSGDDGLSC